MFLITLILQEKMSKCTELQIDIRIFVGEFNR